MIQFTDKSSFERGIEIGIVEKSCFVPRARRRSNLESLAPLPCPLYLVHCFEHKTHRQPHHHSNQTCKGDRGCEDTTKFVIHGVQRLHGRIDATG